MITDQQAQAAWDFINDNADKAGEMRAHRLYLMEFRKSLKSMIMVEHDGKPVSHQEREAYSDDRYLKHLEGYREAVHQDEAMQWRMKAAELAIDSWRTTRADIRSSKI